MKQVYSSPSISTVRVAAVQIESKNCAVGENLSHATKYVEQASRGGAKLVVLPELMPTGYIMSEEIWEGAEASNGLTVRWLRDTSKRLGIWVGTSFLEADGEDFFNTFVLAGPDGNEAGRVRKNPPASVEAYFYRGGLGPHSIDTEIGRIGVGICSENLFCATLRCMYEEAVDLVVQPASAPMPMRSFPFSQSDVEAVSELLRKGPQEYAASLGVPVVLANKTGAWESPMPGLIPTQVSRFAGSSAIVEAGGEVMAYLERNGEGIVVADVALDPEKKAASPPECNGRWAIEVPWYAFMWLVTERMGHRSYVKNQRRRAKALSVARMT